MIRYLLLVAAVVALVTFHFAVLNTEELGGAWRGFAFGFGAGLLLGVAIDRLVIRPGVDYYLRRRARRPPAGRHGVL